jgi:hypothetical protein
MANPWNQLVRMLELRIARQESSLQESKLQLEAAISAQAEYQDGEKPQKDLVQEVAKAKAAGTRST